MLYTSIDDGGTTNWQLIGDHHPHHQKYHNNHRLLLTEARGHTIYIQQRMMLDHLIELPRKVSDRAVCTITADRHQEAISIRSNDCN